jgi:hypothetical protein
VVFCRLQRFASFFSPGFLFVVLMAVLVSAGRPADAMVVVINEIMYHPSRAQGDMEYLELYNDSTVPQEIGGWYFSAGVSYTFPPNTWIAEHGYLVVCENPSVVRAAFPGAPVIGPYSGKLNNAGEQIELRNASGGLVDAVEYKDDDPWPMAADGAGHSLSLIHPDLDNSRAESWTISATIGGTPGAPNFPASPPASTVVVSELQANTTGQTWIELHNPTGSPVPISGWHLSNDPNALGKYSIPNGTALAANGYVFIMAGTLGFSLDPSSGSIYLTNAPLTRVMDAVAYKGTAVGHSRGRFDDRRNHKEHWYYMTNPTPGRANTVTLNDKVVINEIMYHPFAGRPNQDYVELYNRGGQPVDLTAWRFTSGIRYDFPAGTILNPDSYLVVAESTATIVSVYGLPPSRVFGNFQGKLKNDHDHVILRDNYGNIADEVEYYSGGRWPEWADGLGSSLELTDPNQSNDYPSAWAASEDSGKSEWTLVEYRKKQVSGVSFESEFQMMLTDTGVVLLDDMSLSALPAASELLPNGGFEAGMTGWVAGGTHKYSGVLPGIGRNNTKALRLVASRRGTEGPNHIECATNASLTAGGDYVVRYWAKWVVGCNQLLTRTHYHGVAQTTPIPVPMRLGTPGQRNSQYKQNHGPIIADVHHSPVTPTSSQRVTVTALVLDSDGVANVTLYYKTDTATTWNALAMLDDGGHNDGRAGDNVYGAVIAAQPNNTLMEFYVRAQDRRGAFRTFPASEPPVAPPPKRALYRVRDGSRGTTLKTFELLINNEVVNQVAANPRMDNELLDATFVFDDRFAFYNVGFRYRGSAYLRDNGMIARPPYRIHFNSDESFGGLISINLDCLRMGTESGMNDRLVNWLMDTLGGVPTQQEEYVRMFRHTTSDPDRNQGVYEHIRRVDGAFVEDYYPDGADGFLHKVDEHVEWVGGGYSRGNFRIRIPDDTARVKYLGPDEELYRWNFKPRSRELEDDFRPLIALCRFMDPDFTSDPSFTANVENVIEVDEWLKKLAASTVVDDWDTLGMDHGPQPHGKNAYLYQRSDTGKWALLPWDHDIILMGYSSPIYPRWWFVSERRLMTHPIYGRRYLRYIQKLVDGPFSAAKWEARIDLIWNHVFAVEGDTTGLVGLGYLKTGARLRRNWLIASVLPGPSPFRITTNGGADFAVDTPNVTIQGTGGLEVATLQVNGSPAADLTWLDAATWQIRNIPLALGPARLEITAHGEDGAVIATDAITVTRFPSLRALPYSTSFEPNELPPYGVGPLPQNGWVGQGGVQNVQASEGVQAVGIQDGWAEHEFLGQGFPAVWFKTYVRTAGTVEPAAVSDHDGEFAVQLHFSRTQGIQALNGDGRGGGSWVNTGVALDPSRFMKISAYLDYSTHRWDLCVDGRAVATNLGFAYPKPYPSRFRYYSDAPGTLDQVSVTRDVAAPPAPQLASEPPYTRGSTNDLAWSSVGAGAKYYLQWSSDSVFTTLAGYSGWTEATSYVAGGLADGQRYFYRVKSRNAQLIESVWSNVVSSQQDASPPESRVLPVALLTNATTFTLRCLALDSASGVREVWLYYRHGGMGSYTRWPAAFRNGSVVFNVSVAGGAGPYEFYSVATDNVGNVERAHAGPDAATIVHPLGFLRARSWEFYR